MDLLAAEEYETAASRCTAIFEDSDDVRAAVAAARAAEALGRDDEVLSWARRLGDRPEAAEVLGMASEIHWQQGDAEAAGDLLERQIALRRRAGDHREAARALYRLFYLSWETSDYRQALLAAHQSFREADAGEDPEMQRYAAEGLHSVLYAVGDLEGAGRALDAAEWLLTSDDPIDRARLLSNRAVIYLDEGRPALACDVLKPAVALAAGSEDRRLVRSIHLNLVQAHLALFQIERAQDHLQAAWQNAEPDGAPRTSLLYYQARIASAQQRYEEAAATLRQALSESPIPDWAWELEHQLGRAEEARGERAAAVDAYQRATEIVEAMRRSLGFDELKPWLLDRKREPYEALVRLHAEAGRGEDALATVEQAKARTLFEALVHAASVPDEPRRPWAPAAAVGRLEALEALWPPLRESPAAALRPLPEVLAAVGDRHVVIYFAGREQLWLIAVNRQEIRIRPLAASPAEVRKLGERFVARPQDPEPASRLGEALFPTDSLPPPGSTLYLVPDRDLGHLPFAALRRHGRYLVEDYALAYLPSLNALAASESRRHEVDGPAVVLGDPHGDLPGAAREAREVAEHLQVSAFLAGEADGENLRRAARARVLHLATHTGLGPSGPWLRLADGELTAGTLVAEGLAPRLVVVSGCASAARRVRGMWGSLGAAFFAAGSRAVVASLWLLEDQSAREFIVRFYHEGGAGDPAGALARTQRAWIADGRPPTSWAPFVILGSELSP